jgi:transcriptional regulator GlxA family with amidase domain
VKQLAFLAGISRRQLERQFEMTGLGSPADFVAMLVATDR